MPHDQDGHSSHNPVPDTGKMYETRDVSLIILVKWCLFLFAFVGASSFIGLLMFKYFVPQDEEATQPNVRRQLRQMPTGPRLQADPVEDIKAYREKEEQAVASYGRDPHTSAIHIPIDRAIDLVLPDLPIRPGAVEVDIKQTTAPNTPITLDGQAPRNSVSPNSAAVGRDQPAETPASNTGQ